MTRTDLEQQLYDVVYRAVQDAMRDATAQPPAQPSDSGLQRLTVNEAAQKTGRAAGTIRLALQAGELHGVQRVKGGRWLIQAECLLDWAAGNPCSHVSATATRANR